MGFRMKRNEGGDEQGECNESKRGGGKKRVGSGGNTERRSAPNLPLAPCRSSIKARQVVQKGREVM